MASLIDAYLDHQLVLAEAAPWMTAEAEPDPECEWCLDRDEHVAAVRGCAECGEALCNRHARDGYCPSCWDDRFGGEGDCE